MQNVIELVPKFGIPYTRFSQANKEGPIWWNFEILWDSSHDACIYQGRKNGFTQKKKEILVTERSHMKQTGHLYFMDHWTFVT